MAANRVKRDIPNFGPFWVVKIQEGPLPPPPPPDKNIPGGWVEVRSWILLYPWLYVSGRSNPYIVPTHLGNWISGPTLGNQRLWYVQPCMHLNSNSASKSLNGVVHTVPDWPWNSESSGACLVHCHCIWKIDELGPFFGWSDKETSSVTSPWNHWIYEILGRLQERSVRLTLRTG